VEWEGAEVVPIKDDAASRHSNPPAKNAQVGHPSLQPAKNAQVGHPQFVSRVLAHIGLQQKDAYVWSGKARK
jgi:hypothetical protein